MFLLIATIIFGSIIAFFSTHNAGPVDLHFANYHLAAVPVYWVVLGTVLVTLVFSSLLFLINSISSSFVLHGRDNTVKKLKKENDELSRKVQQLEIDKARLEGKKETRTTEEV